MKVLTKWLRKYHFWVLLVVVIVVATAGWTLASGQLSETFKKNQSAINNAFNGASSIRGIERHPNDEYLEKMEEHIKATRTSVWKAWVTKYEKQGKLFVWPDELGPAFLNVVTDLRPFETKVPYPLADELLRIDQREEYAYFIRAELPRLAARIGAQWKAQETGGDFRPGVPMPRGEGEAGAGTSAMNFNEMNWNPANQQEIYDDHFNWSNQADRAPTTLQILYAQEDLWVFRALMDIIRKTNRGTTSQTGLDIPYIDFIRIGKSAKWTQGQIGGGGSGGGGIEAGVEESPRQPEKIDAGEARSPKATVGGDPADGRYVDMENNPLSGEQLRGTTGEVGTEQGTLAVAKRVPVQMRLLISQVELNRLLVECGNSPLTVEVQQLQFNPTVDAGPRRGAGTPPTRAPAVSTGLANKDRIYRTIELYGIISMYNPVNSSALGIEEPAAEEAGDATGEASETGEATPSAPEGAAAPEDAAAAAAAPTDDAADAAAVADPAAAAAATEPADATTPPSPATEPGGVAP